MSGTTTLCKRQFKAKGSDKQTNKLKRGRKRSAHSYVKDQKDAYIVNQIASEAYDNLLRLPTGVQHLRTQIMLFKRNSLNVAILFWFGISFSLACNKFKLFLFYACELSVIENGNTHYQRTKVYRKNI